MVRRVRRPSCSHCQPWRRASMTRSAIMSIAVSRSSDSHPVPPGRRYSIWYWRAAADRGVGVPLDLDDLLVLDVHVLGAADRAVRAHRLHDLVGRGGPGLEGRAVRGLGGRAEPERIRPGQLPVYRPGLDPGARAHPDILSCGRPGCSYYLTTGDLNAPGPPGVGRRPGRGGRRRRPAEPGRGGGWREADGRPMGGDLTRRPVDLAIA